MKKRVVAVVAVIVLLVGASVASIIYMKSGKNDGISKYQTIAFCLYFFVTPSFALTSYSSDEKGNKYFATTVSLYTIVTIVAYTIIAIVFK